MLPAGMPAERQTATYTLAIFRGEDIPQTDGGIMASVKKAITSKVDMVDAFVKVSFMGLVVSKSMLVV